MNKNKIIGDGDNDWKIPKVDWIKFDFSNCNPPIRKIKLIGLNQPFWCKYIAIPDIFNGKGEVTYWHVIEVNILIFIFLYVKWELIIRLRKWRVK